MFGSRKQWLQSMCKLLVTVWGNANEHWPVLRDWMWFGRLIDHLVKVDSEGVVVPSKRRHYLMHHLFTFEQHGTSHSWTDIYDFIDAFTFRVQAKHSRMHVWRCLNSVNFVVQKDDHTDFSKWFTMDFIILGSFVGVFVALIVLFFAWCAIIASKHDLLFVYAKRFIS